MSRNKDVKIFRPNGDIIHVGRIASFDQVRRFGFIASDDLSGVFFHVNNWRPPLELFGEIDFNINCIRTLKGRFYPERDPYDQRWEQVVFLKQQAAPGPKAFLWSFAEDWIDALVEQAGGIEMLDY